MVEVYLSDDNHPERNVAPLFVLVLAAVYIGSVLQI